MTKIECTFKATIIGCGSVGATTAYAYLLSGSVANLTLIDVDKGRAQGLKLDIVSNPVDILTYEAIRQSGLPWQRVFGSGTILDSSRLQYHISERVNVHPCSIDAYVLGEHGDTSFPVFSSANILGKSLFEFEGFNRKVAKECYEDTKNAAYRIIHDQGYTCYSIATVVRELNEAIFEDKKQVFTLSVLLDDYYGHSNVCLSVPCVLGQNGIEKILKVPLDKGEKELLEKSVIALKQYIEN